MEEKNLGTEGTLAYARGSDAGEVIPDRWWPPRGMSPGGGLARTWQRPERGEFPPRYGYNHPLSGEHSSGRPWRQRVRSREGRGTSRGRIAKRVWQRPRRPDEPVVRSRRLQPDRGRWQR